MPEFAEINTQTNEVLRVIGAKSKLWCEYELDGTWFRTYYDTEGKNYAGIGWVYHPEKENFSAPNLTLHGPSMTSVNGKPPCPNRRVKACIFGTKRLNHGRIIISSCRT